MSPITWKTIIIRQYKEEWWLGFWRWYREVDILFVIREDTTMDFIYKEIRGALKIPDDKRIVLFNSSPDTPRIIYCPDEFIDKEMYIIRYDSP